MKGDFSRSATYILSSICSFGRLVALKTHYPLILTARIAESDLKPFDDMRLAHFPPKRNFLKAHLTMFHRLPGEYRDAITDILRQIGAETKGFTAEAGSLRHLGGGVAFEIASPELDVMRARLRAAFLPWLGPQDMRPWRPHITIQNTVERAAADRLYEDLQRSFRPLSAQVVGLDLWHYLDGPWGHEATISLAAG